MSRRSRESVRAGMLCAILIAVLGVMSFHGGVAAQSLEPDDGMLTVMTWNLGYGGLGADADFRADGGRMLRTPSREAAEANVAAIADHLAAAQADVIFLQEVSEPTWANRRVDLLGAICAARPDDALDFTPTARVRGPFELSRSDVGLAMLTHAPDAHSRTLELESPFSLAALFVRQDYRAQIAHIPDGRGGGWALINVHLSAFDDEAKLRARQLQQLMAAALAEYEAGWRVVIGGDFNLVLTQTDFPHTTQEKHLFWLHPFPQDVLPDGWRVVADNRTPSVRTNERPYRPGENHTNVIDGFIISPDVEVVDVTTQDLGFQHSDHHPVTGRFRAIAR